METHTTVALAKVSQAGGLEAAIRAVAGSQLDKLIKSGDVVLIKPNLVGGWSPDRGVTVHPQAIKAVALLAREIGARRLIIGEDAGRDVDTTQVFVDMGLDKLAREVGVDLADLARQGHRRVPVPMPLVAEEIEMSNLALECDKLVGLAVLKTHHQAGISAVMKNMYGLIPHELKRRFHRVDIERAIVDINSVRKADFTVIDGLIGLEGIGPHLGDSVLMDLVLAGPDPVAIDTICARIMGFQTGELRYLSWAQERGLGICELERIYLQGPSLDSISRPFATTLDHVKKKVAGYVDIVDDTRCNGCCGVVATTFMLLLGRHGRTLEEFKGLKIYLGKGKRAQPRENLIIVGDCAEAYQELGTFVAGCPPSITQLMEEVSQVDLHLTQF